MRKCKMCGKREAMKKHDLCRICAIEEFLTNHETRIDRLEKEMQKIKDAEVEVD